MNYAILFLVTLSAVALGFPVGLYLVWLMVARSPLLSAMAAVGDMIAKQSKGGGSVGLGGAPIPDFSTTFPTEDDWEKQILETEKRMLDVAASDKLRQKVFDRLAKEGKIPVLSATEVPPRISFPLRDQERSQ